MRGAGPGSGLGHLFSAGRGLWHPQFGYLIWPLGLWALWAAWRQVSWRRWVGPLGAMVTIQFLFWVLATHHQSRFLTPVLVPLSMGVGRGVAAAGSGRAAGATLAAGGATVVALCLQGQVLFWSTKNGAAPQWIGGVVQAQRAAPQVNPFAALNALGPEARIYSEGFATPFYVTTPIDYHTVWDRSPLGRVLAEGGPAAVHRWLVEEGYSHVVIDWGMLRRWWDRGNYGYDPNITEPVLRSLTERQEMLQALEPWHDRPLRIYRVQPLGRRDRLVDRFESDSYRDRHGR